MNTTLLHRRRIERLAQLLDEAEGARRHHTRSALDDDLNDLVDVGHRLMDIHPQVEMRESARRDIRAVIMAAAQRDGIGVTAKTTADPAIGRARVGAIADTPGGRRPFARRVRARGAVLVGLAVGTLAVSGIAAASGTAMPGDALYGLKRSQETAQLQLSGSPASKGQLYLDFAGKRLAEAQSDTGDPNGLIQLVNQMDSDTLQGARLLFAAALASHDKAALQTVADFYSHQKDQLGQLRSQLRPGTAVFSKVLSYDNDLDLINDPMAADRRGTGLPDGGPGSGRQVGTQCRTVRLGGGRGQRCGYGRRLDRTDWPRLDRARRVVNGPARHDRCGVHASGGRGRRRLVGAETDQRRRARRDPARAGWPARLSRHNS